MAIKVSRNDNIQAKEKSTEQSLKEQQEHIQRLEEDKVKLQILTAEIFEQSLADKTKMQTALAELAETVSSLFE